MWVEVPDSADESIAAHEDERRYSYSQDSGRRTFSSLSPWLRPAPKLDFWDD